MAKSWLSAAARAGRGFAERGCVGQQAARIGAARRLASTSFTAPVPGCGRSAAPTSRSARSAATPRSCVTRSTAVPLSRRSSSIRSRDAPLHRDVGARWSARRPRSAGLQRHRDGDQHALFHPAREFVRVLARAHLGRRQADPLCNSMTRAWIALRSPRLWICITSASCAPMVRTGLSERAARVLRDQADDRAANGIQPLLRPVRDVGAVVRRMVAALDAAVACQQAKRGLRRRGLAEPDSPTSATTSPGADAEGDAVHHRCSRSPVL